MLIMSMIISISIISIDIIDDIIIISIIIMCLTCFPCCLLCIHVAAELLHPLVGVCAVCEASSKLISPVLLCMLCFKPIHPLLGWTLQGSSLATEHVQMIDITTVVM